MKIRKHLSKEEVAGIAIDIKARNSMAHIMLSWDCGHATVERVKNALKLIEHRASIGEICAAVEEHKITNVMADYAVDEIKRLYEEEQKLAEHVFENNAIDLEKSSDFTINEIGYTLMSIESLLEELLKAWKA